MSPLSSLLLTLSGFAAGRLVDFFRDYQPPRRGLVDLLPWAFLVDREPQGVILNKNGSFTAAFEIQGPDRASSTDEQLNSLSAHVSRAFGPFVTSWTFHFDAIRRSAPGYPPEGDFPDPVSRLLDEGRRWAYLQHGALYEATSVLCATFRPPREVYQHLLLRLQQGVQLERRHWEDTLAGFKMQLEGLRSRLSGPVRVRPLDGPELLTHLNRCLNSRHHSVSDPGEGVYLDQILATQHVTTCWEPVVGTSQPKYPSHRNPRCCLLFISPPLRCRSGNDRSRAPCARNGDGGHS
jgi:hypothetical protein